MNGRQLWIGTAGGISILFQDALHVVLGHHFIAAPRSWIEQVTLRVSFGMVKAAVILIVLEKRILRNGNDTRLVPFAGNSDVWILFIYNDVL